MTPAAMCALVVMAQNSQPTVAGRPPKSHESGDACSPSSASGWQCEAAATVPPGKA